MVYINTNFSIFLDYFLQILKIVSIIFSCRLINKFYLKYLLDLLAIPSINKNKKQPVGLLKDLLYRTVRIAITCQRSLLPVKTMLSLPEGFQK